VPKRHADHDKASGRLQSKGTDTFQLVVDYVKQETLEPLKGLGRFIVFGVAGSVALAAGFVVLAVALLRVLQGETGTTFHGNLSWLPYVICAAASIGVAAVAVASIRRGQARRSLERDKETA
jgi:Putative Actinobacterial Holin-X, holin superfamily III